MLTITGQKYRFCDGISRRGFLTVGGLALGGATLTQLPQTATIPDLSGRPRYLVDEGTKTLAELI